MRRTAGLENNSDKLSARIAADNLAKRSYPPAPARNVEPRAPFGGDGPQSIKKPTTYPTAVSCGVLVEVVSTKTNVVTAKTSVIALPRSTLIVPTFVTKTISYTVTGAPASRTTVLTTTLTTTTTLIASTSLTTVSTTPTLTVNSPEATYYAACAPNNIYNGTLTGNPVNYDNFDNSQPQYYGEVDGVATPYDCCVFCLTETMYGQCGAVYTAYNSDNPADGVTCYPYYTGDARTCSQDYVIANYYSDGDYENVDLEIFSNGPCGQETPG